MKMRSLTLLTIALVFMAIFCMANAEDQCMCSCCRGAGCTPVYIKPMFDLPGACTDPDCTAACPKQYSDQCGQVDSVIDAMCMGPMSSAPTLFNQYMTFALVFLGAIIKTIFHF